VSNGRFRPIKVAKMSNIQTPESSYFNLKDVYRDLLSTTSADLKKNQIEPLLARKWLNMQTAS